ncbi:MAG: bifunctional DNA-formamidopyrimidine glycosylase/DNA-(apurinic or apyrimidinic site) lyase [Bacilli bacterium]
MPELPEVEAVRRTVEPLIAGRTIADLDCTYLPMIRQPNDLRVWKEQLKGQTVTHVERRAKFLIITTTDWHVIIHLRMEGKVRVYDESTPRDKHTHLVIMFTDCGELHYHDVRKFGTFDLVARGALDDFPSIAALAPEAHADTLTVEWLAKKMSKTTRPIKNVLLDQTVVSGLGNIYVDEVLWHSKISPYTVANSLTIRQIEALHLAMREVISAAVDQGGTTIRSYLNAQGKAGTYQQALVAYGRKGEACLRCGEAIEKGKLSGRGTHYCPICQPTP